MFKLIKYGLKNLWYWLPTIWQDRDWDYYFIFKILQKKLTKHRLWLENGSPMPYVGIKKDIKNIHLCELLLQRLLNDDYLLFSGQELDMKFLDDGEVEFVELKKGTKIGIYSSPNQWEDYLIKQDLTLLCKTIEKQIRCWWD